jgi:glycosyltransferase involved in cell wall biosynthesis
MFKGGNHLSLLEALPEVQFTVLTNRTKPKNPDLPVNVTVKTIEAKLGPYYYGFSDFLFARAVLKRYPVHHPFWKTFDLLHLNQTMGPALLSLKHTGIPLCLLIHHPVSTDMRIALEESNAPNRLLWKLRYTMLIAWQKRYCRDLRNIITVSQTAADRIVEEYGCKREKIHVVLNGVDTEEFVPKNLTHTAFDVIAIGSFMHPRKGFRYLEQVYRKLSLRGYTIADVGRRSDAQRDILHSIANVQSFGTIEHAQLLSLIQQSKALISTSLYEGFGLSLIEALACGRPSFAFDAGATGEVLRPIDSNLLVPLRDADALANRVIAFLDLPQSEQITRGLAYRTAIQTTYPLRASAQALHHVYDRMIH